MKWKMTKKNKDLAILEQLEEIKFALCDITEELRKLNSILYKRENQRETERICKTD